MEAKKMKAKRPKTACVVRKSQNNKYFDGISRKHRHVRQSMVMNSALLAFQHRISYPKQRLGYQMKKEREEVLDHQEDIDKTRLIFETVQNNGTDESDMNTFCFGWDALSEKNSNSSQQVWEQVADHLELSVFLKELLESKKSQVDTESIQKAFSLLQQFIDTVPEEIFQSTLTVIKQILLKSVYQSNGETYHSECKRLNAANKKLKEETKLLKMELAQNRENGKEKDPYVIVEAQLLAYDAKERFGVIIPFFENGFIELNSINLLRLCSIQTNRHNESFLSPFVKSLNKQELQIMMKSFFSEKTSIDHFGEMLNADPTLEKQVFVQCRSQARQIAFWESNQDAFADILWFSSELIQSVITTRPEISGKFFSHYNSWLTKNQAKKGTFENRTSLQNLVGTIIEKDDGFLEHALVNNRQVLRRTLENHPDLVSSIAASSSDVVGFILDASGDALAPLLMQRGKMLNELLQRFPDFLIEIANADRQVFINALEGDPKLVPYLCTIGASTMFQLVQLYSPILAQYIAKSQIAIIDVFDCSCESMDVVFTNHPRLLTTNITRLKILGLRNIHLYNESCTSQHIQTDPIPNSQGVTVSRSLNDIVGKRRVGKVCDWTEASVHDIIARLYQCKVTADIIDTKAGYPKEAFPEVIYDHFVELYPGDTARAKKELANFLTALRFYSNNSQIINWFSLVAGATNHHEPFNPQGIDFLLSVLCSLVPSNTIEECLVLNDGIAMIPIESALTNLESVLKLYWYNDDALESVRSKLTDLPVDRMNKNLFAGDIHEEKLWAKVPDGGGKYTSKYIYWENKEEKNRSFKNVVHDKLIIPKTDSQLASNILCLMKNMNISGENGGGQKCVPLVAVVHLLMREWLASEKIENEILVNLFIKSDTNGDGILDLGEFEAMVLVVDPYCDSRTISRMFKMTGEENDDGEHVISPCEFVSVMRQQRYCGQALAHLFDTS